MWSTEVRLPFSRSAHETVREKNMADKYPALNAISVIMKIFGWVSIASGIVLLAVLI
jgi:hypothetical protein